MPREIDSVPSSDERIKWRDLVKPFEFPDKDWQIVRPVGPVWTDYRHAVTTKNGKRYYEYCHAWNSEKDDFVDNREEACECCRLQLAGTTGAGGAKIVGQYRYYMNVLHYLSEENAEGEMVNSLQGVFLLEMSSSLFKRVQDLKKANGNFPVTHPERGALVLIKFDKSQEPANMYSASLDTKNVALDKEALQNVIVQKYADGSKKKLQGDGKKPAMWEYLRQTSSREEMRRSLRTQGYYQQEAGAPSGSNFSKSYQDFQKQNEVDFGVPFSDDVEVSPAPQHLKNVVSRPAQDEEPAPKARPVAAAASKPSMTLAEAEAAAYEGCPTSFGDFAGSVDCFSVCKVNSLCKSETEKKQAALGAAARKKPAQQKFLDDDDTL